MTLTEEVNDLIYEMEVAPVCMPFRTRLDFADTPKCTCGGKLMTTIVPGKGLVKQCRRCGKVVK